MILVMVINPHKIVFKYPDISCFIRAGGEDDFESFLENVKARSLAARTRALPSQGELEQFIFLFDVHSHTLL